MFDVIVWGASGFTGRLVADYLFRRYGIGGELNWAVGGRNAAKLDATLGELGADGVPVVTGDSASADSMKALAAQARVICTTVGPYAKYGSALVAACAESGTHYCDLSGEVPWMRAMIDAHEPAARESGACIVHSCGFDSVPSDLGVHFLQRETHRRHGRYCREIRFGLQAARGGPSGGTVASLLNVVDQARSDRSTARLLRDPYALNPHDARNGPDAPDQRGPAYDDVLKAWTAPFVMAGINTRIVRRSNAIADFPYGRDFRYSETQMMGRGPGGRLRAYAFSLGLGGFLFAAAIGPTRRLLQMTLLPEPGEGPDAEQRENGYFRIRLVGLLDDGTAVRATVTGDRDPGYGSTSKMLAEAAVCLAQDERPDGIGGGFFTPSTALGDAYLERLIGSSGLTFAIEA